MRNLIALIIIMTNGVACGKIRVSPIKINDSEHVVRHIIEVKDSRSIFEESCERQFPGDVVAQFECVELYVEILENASRDIINPTILEL